MIGLDMIATCHGKLLSKMSLKMKMKEKVSNFSCT